MTIKRWLAVAALFAWWGFIAFRMVLSAQRDGGPTGLPGDLVNWHNRPGEPSSFLALTVGELVTVLAILRPHSYAHSWRRSLAAVALLTPWLLLFAAMMIHSGGIMVLHVVWLGGLWVGLVLLVGVSALLKLSSRGQTVARAI